jgi:hypothetical protein
MFLAVPWMVGCVAWRAVRIVPFVARLWWAVVRAEVKTAVVIYEEAEAIGRGHRPMP